MENFKSLLLLATVFILCSSFPALGKNNTTTPNINNGYPSGFHHNLNIIAKDRENFTCPEAEYEPDPITGEPTDIPIYGNVIFIPSDGEGIQILMESGRKGPKGAEETTELQVTDWCAGFEEDDPAVLRLPKNEEGYAVYARAKGKPSDEAVIKIYDPGLKYVTDGTDDLIVLGLLKDGAFGSYLETFRRPKGKTTAVPITPLFMWEGWMCDFIAPDGYNPDSPEYTAFINCCLEPDPTGAPGVYSECIDPTLNGDLLECPAEYVERIVYCEWQEATWVFNLEDFVGYFWNVDNSGIKILKVRFYPTQNVVDAPN